MLEAIKFTRGAVAKKDYVAELTHFHIRDNRITGFNGVMALSAPIDIELDVRPKATTFANAVQRCEEQVSIHMTKAGRLSLKSGKFRALIDCLPDDGTTAPVAPEGWDIDVGPAFMDAIRAVEKFQGIDASRPWAMGVLFHNQSVLATNNVIFAEYWHGHQMPFNMQIPSQAVNELLRIGEAPIRVTATEHSATFHFEGDRWMRTALVAQGWPDGAIDLLNKHTFDYQPVPEDLFEALGKLKPFIDKDHRVHFRDGALHTSASDELGASYDVEGLPDGPCFAYPVLQLLEGITAVDFSPHPAPCGFLAEGMRGMFLGLRV